ncbi:MAG TPA: hypothetical protein VG102_00705 [Candidatus Paceibacterota bacterium]|nr:hypothetical protein [Candidatus Paceibacterota bacterium]
MSHSVADIETYAYIREFWKGIDQTLFGLTTDPNLFYSRIFQERENVTELAEMIPIWWEKRRILAQSTIIDCAKKIQRAQKLCEAIMKQEIVAEPAA